MAVTACNWREFFVDDVRSKRIPPDLEARLFRKIQMIDDATTDQDLRVPPGNPLEKLAAKPPVARRGFRRFPKRNLGITRYRRNCLEPRATAGRQRGFTTPPPPLRTGQDNAPACLGLSAWRGGREAEGGGLLNRLRM